MTRAENVLPNPRKLSWPCRTCGADIGPQSSTCPEGTATCHPRVVIPRQEDPR